MTMPKNAKLRDLERYSKIKNADGMEELENVLYTCTFKLGTKHPLVIGMRLEKCHFHPNLAQIICR